ncbi:hypothetical protein GOODEAATRI_031987, partial [Goodea atripinnis]
LEVKQHDAEVKSLDKSTAVVYTRPVYSLHSDQVQQLTATVILLGTVLLLCPLASTFSELVAFSAAHGLVYGATVAIHITVLSEVVGVERLGSALGFFMLIRSSGGLLGPPIAGKL